ncbi:WHG domain-containing protein [Streptomyces sp. NPDC003015]
MSGEATEASRRNEDECFRYFRDKVAACADAGVPVTSRTETARVLCAGVHGAVSLLIHQERDAWPPDSDRYIGRAASSAVHGALLTASDMTRPSLAGVPQSG